MNLPLVPAKEHQGASNLKEMLSDCLPICNELVDENQNSQNCSSYVETSQITRNRFESFEDFQEFVRKGFVEGSAIDPELFEACVEFHQDIECGYGGEVEAPIHEVLDWDYKRFRHQANETLYAAFLKNEDGSIWQAVVSLWDEEKQRPYVYMV
jgi:putative DNA primase/helicase